MHLSRKTVRQDSAGVLARFVAAVCVVALLGTVGLVTSTVPEAGAQTRDQPRFAQKSDAGEMDNLREIIRKQNRELCTKLIAAAKEGNEFLAEKWVDQGAKLDCTDDRFGGTPLHWAAFNGHLNVVELLVSRGAPIDATNNDGRTPLIMASAKGHRKVVRYLLTKGAHIGTADKDGRTALDWAKKDAVKQLIEGVKQHAARPEFGSGGALGFAEEFFGEGALTPPPGMPGFNPEDMEQFDGQNVPPEMQQFAQGFGRMMIMMVVQAMKKAIQTKSPAELQEMGGKLRSKLQSETSGKIPPGMKITLGRLADALESGDRGEMDRVLGRLGSELQQQMNKGGLPSMNFNLKP